MRHPRGRQRPSDRPAEGFSLVVTVLMMALLSLLAIGMLALSSIQLRVAGADQDQALARANARLALQQAIAQLQLELGPDQRISAAADIVSPDVDRHWTGVWSTTQENGDSWWQRDPATGSWVDERFQSDWEAAEQTRKWLVSGDAQPGADSKDRIELVGSASVGDQPEDLVSAPLVPVGGARPGALAWWTGDLGLRADVSVTDRHRESEGDFKRILGQQPALELIGEGFPIAEERRDLLISPGTVDLAGARDWSRLHFHDFTIHSQGVQADVRDGGLKRDLGPWFDSEGTIEPYRGLAGIDAEEPLLAQLDGEGPRPASPSMKLLHDWASSTVPWSGNGVSTVAPETGRDRDSEDYALSNETPVLLDGATQSNLQPVLVEASNYMQISTFETRDIPARYQLRHHLYPRVVLWNPYNVQLEFDPAIVMIQGNGRQEMWTRDTAGRRLAWLSFEGGRSTDFVDNLTGILNSAAYDDPYMGSYYFSIPKTTFGPGECLVFSPERSGEYDGLSAYRLEDYDLAANRLSCEVAPDPARSFYVSGSDIGGGIRYQPTEFWYAPTPFWWVGLWSGIENQADDTRAVMKRLTDDSPVDFERFDALPQLSYLSASLQYGAGKEPRIAWNDQTPMEIELLDRDKPRPTLNPDVRTRQGIRLRWFEEHPSNLGNAGPMTGNRSFFQEALFATWNPRASYVLRSPWENLAGSLPAAGNSGGGPWFFGAYTRDLYDEAVGWNLQFPRLQNGRFHGNPFGLPQEGYNRHILFELPRRETGILSLGQLQSAKLSELIWHPSFAFGNSLADPRLGLYGLDRTTPVSDAEGSAGGNDFGGFNPEAIGWSNDNDRSENRDAWAEQGRALLQDLPEDNLMVYDLSYEVNHALWDAYFVSSGSPTQKTAFLADPLGQPLPNGRMSLVGAGPDEASELDFHRAARHLVVDGAFNVNSTRVEAWKAVLAATRDGDEGSPFRRVLGLDDDFDGERVDRSAWGGFRTLTDEEIGSLAEAIVEQVRLRGPFLSMSDFVNRRLRLDTTGRMGALEAAIEAADLNEAFINDELAIENSEQLDDYRHPDNITDPTRLEQTLKPESMAWGAPGFLTQGDLLQVLAPTIQVRSDSFVIRAYGDARDPDGKVLARAWCEAVVQRTPEPLEPGPDGLNPRPSEPERTDFGRRFEVIGFRWLKPEEI